MFTSATSKRAKVFSLAAASIAVVGGTLVYALPKVSADTAVLDHVSLTAPAASVAAGGTLQYSATAKDASDAAITSDVTYAWGVIAGGGTISSSGLFTAGTVTGTYTDSVQVIATQGAIFKIMKASVTVTAGTPTPTPPIPKAGRPAVVWTHMYRAMLGHLGFKTFVKGNVTTLDANGNEVTHTAIAGVVTAITQTGFTIDPNGTAASASYTITADTVFLPGKKMGNDGLALLNFNDQVLVGLNADKLMSVLVVPVRKDDEKKVERQKAQDEKVAERAKAARQKIEEKKEQLERKLKEREKKLDEKLQKHDD